MINKLLFSLLFLFVSVLTYGQEKTAPLTISQGKLIKKTIPLRDMPTQIPSIKEDASEFKIIQNRLKANRKINQSALPSKGDPVAQRAFGGVKSLMLEQNFDGANSSEGQATPPDPSGAVGPNHYVHAVNLVVKIFDKSGNLLVGPVFLGNFLGNGNNSGDPIIMYDHLADRFFVSQFDTSNNGLVIGISETPDPTGAYFIYEFPLDAFPDYPHYAVWHNAYFMTANKFSGNTTYAIERDAMIAGESNPQLIGFNLPGVVNNPNTVFSPEPANLIGADFDPDAPGYITYLQDDGWGGGITFDHLKVWEIDLDWDNTANSTISSPIEIPTAPFEATFAPFGTGDVQQPGTSQKIDMIGGVISYAANYRAFDDHNKWLITFNVDVDGNDLSGIRWIELRNDDVTDWSIFQEGTYAPDDGLSRFMGSGAIDALGNIGLAFNIASADLAVGIRYTGRFDGDPAGEMTVEETTIVDGVGVQTFSNRFGDYSHLSMDPDNFTFWHTAEYFPSTNNWSSRIASFRLSGGFDADVGVNGITSPMNGLLTASETVEITIRNYGSMAQSNIPVDLYVDDVLVASETVTDVIEPNEVATYTFTQTVDLSNQGQTYVLRAETLLTGDEFDGNDDYDKEVTHLNGNDVGVIEITSPVTGEGLSAEAVTVTVRNFGAVDQTVVPVSYSINGGDPVVEVITETIEAEGIFEYTFTEPADLSALGVYSITAATDLANDEDNTNNIITKEVEHLQCLPTANCSFGDGLERFSIGTIDNITTCSTNGYGDFTDQSTELELDSTIDVITSTGFSNQIYSMWIDFNDNSVFETSELVITDFLMEQTDTDYTTTFDLSNDQNLLGTHLVRVRAGWAVSEDTSADACIDFTYGETEDYTVTLVNQALSIEEETFNATSLQVNPIGINQYDIRFDSDISFDNLRFEIFNTIGQRVSHGDLAPSANGAQTIVDLSSKASGMYLVRVSSGNFSKVKRLIVR